MDENAISSCISLPYEAITICLNVQVIPTKRINISLTINNPTLCKRIKAVYMSCFVRPYIPNPLQCFPCQRYSHSKSSSRESITCAFCSEIGHNINTCDNCKGDHPAFSRNCSKSILEKEIKAISNNVTYPKSFKKEKFRTSSVAIP